MCVFEILFSLFYTFPFRKKERKKGKKKLFMEIIEILSCYSVSSESLCAKYKHTDP